MLRIRFIISTAALLSAAACAAEPTAAPPAVPSRPSLDSGYGLGSGNKSDSLQTNTASTTSGAAASGYGLGSGN